MGATCLGVCYKTQSSNRTALALQYEQALALRACVALLPNIRSTISHHGILHHRRRCRPCAQRFYLQPLPATARWNSRVIKRLADHRGLNVTTE